MLKHIHMAHSSFPSGFRGCNNIINFTQFFFQSHMEHINLPGGQKWRLGEEPTLYHQPQNLSSQSLYQISSSSLLRCSQSTVGSVTPFLQPLSDFAHIIKHIGTGILRQNFFSEQTERIMNSLSEHHNSSRTKTSTLLHTFSCG